MFTKLDKFKAFLVVFLHVEDLKVTNLNLDLDMLRCYVVKPYYNAPIVKFFFT